jgi:lipoprotein NlpI
VATSTANLDAAIDDYTTAAALDPRFSYTFSERGYVYWLKGDFDKALADLNTAIQLDPENISAYANRGNVYFRKQDLDRAIADYSKAIALDPTDTGHYDNRGIMYKAKGEFDLALADLDKAVELDPKIAEAYNDRGFVYQAKGDLDHAIADYDKAVELNPLYDDAYLNRGLAKLFSGPVLKARVDVNRAAELAPGDAYKALWLDVIDKRAGCTNRLATALINTTQWPGAVVRMFLGEMTPDVMFAAATDADAELKNEKVCSANVFSGEFALQQGKKDEAIRRFRAAVADCPKSLIEWPVANAELKALGVTP